MADRIDLTQLYEEIYRVLPSGNIQTLMEVCHKKVGVPILAVDITYNVLGIAPQVPTGDYMWDYLLEHRGYETDMVVGLYEEGIIQSVDTSIAPYVVDWGSCKDAPKIQGIIKLNNIVEGYVTMNCTYDQITPDRMKAMDIIMHVCAYFLKGNESESNMNHIYQKVFASELFNNRIRSQKQLITWFKDMSFELAPPYAVSAVCTSGKAEKNVLSYIRKSTQHLNPYQLMLIQNDVLYILYYNIQKSQQSQAAQSAIKGIMVKFSAQCGVSNFFNNLLDISTYQKQAEDAMDLGQLLEPEEHLHYYNDNYLPALLVPRLRNMPRENYVPEVINKIEEYDKTNSTDFFITLQCYIRNLSSTLETSKELHVHRNTLMYRINKIEELFELSLKDYQTFMHLMIVFYMIDLEKKIPV